MPGPSPARFLEAGREDLRGDRRGDFAAGGAGVDQQHPDRQLGAFGRGEGGEPGVLDLDRVFGVLLARAPGPSSAVPVLPATWASGIAPAKPVPLVTTPIISSVSSPATFFDITRTGSASGRSFLLATIEVGSRTPSLPIVCATLAISQRRRQHFALADRAHPEVEFVADLVRGCSIRAGRPARDDLAARRGSGGELKPNRSAVSTSSSLPIFGAERGEVGVAGLGERFAEGAAAVLAVGVFDEAAADVDPVGDFEVVVER